MRASRCDISLSALLLLAAYASAHYANSHSPTVTLDSGVYVGTTTRLATATPVVNKFLGIPFAAPAERFVKPQPVVRSKAVKKATTLPPVCYQQFDYPEFSRNVTVEVFNNPPPEESEDCLYLNVFAPAQSKRGYGGKGKAVMYWIFGGGFQFGGGSLPQYDGTSFAANQDVIVVTPNYRTNVFGFPGDVPDVPEESRNLGFYDQRAGLQWVQKNIAKFGGDPRKVTIFGESAGAASVDLLILTTPKNPPFRAGILESGSASISRTSSSGNGTTPFQSLATALNCTGPDTFNCVKSAPALTIKSIAEHQALGFPSIAPDNKTTVSDALTRRANRQIANVPILIGTNAQEYQIFLFFAYGGNISAVDFDTVVGASVPTPGAADFFRKYYPPNSTQYPTDFYAAAALVTDLAFNCPAATVAETSAKAGYRTWRYLYNATFPNTSPFPGAGVYHASEIPQIFGLYPERVGEPALPPPTADELALSAFMQKSWADFAKNPYIGPPWKAYNATGVPTLGELGGRNKRGVTNVPVTENDKNCQLFSSLMAMS